MKKYFTSGFISTFIIMAVALGSFIPQVQAQTAPTPVITTPGDFVVFLYQQGIITGDQAVYALTLPGFQKVSSMPVTLMVSDTGASVVKPVVPTTVVGKLSPSGVQASCDLTSVTLNWGGVFAGPAKIYGVRVDDTTANGWGGKTGGTNECAGYNGDGDLCSDVSMFRTPSSAFPVQAGHSYNYWVDTFTGTTTSTTFSIPKCSTTDNNSNNNTTPKPTVDLKIATTTSAGIYTGGEVTIATGTHAWLGWTSTNASSCSASASPATSVWSSSLTIGTSSASTTIGSIDVARDYTITCTGPGGTNSDTVSVSLPQAQVTQPSITSFTVSTTSASTGYTAGPVTINSGANIWLKWSTTHANSCTVTGLSGTATSSSGTLVSGLTTNQNYNLNCVGETGSTPATDQVVVNVFVPKTTDTVTIGTTPDGTTLACTVKNVTLAWAPVSGATSYNIRVNDTVDGWNGKCSAADPANPLDLCWNGYSAGLTSLPNYIATAGHSYNFWVDAVPNGTSQSVAYKVATCN